MAISIIIVGGLTDEPEHSSLLHALSEKSGDEVDWEWIRADSSASWEPPNKHFRRLLGSLRRLSPKDDRSRVVLLHQLHGRSRNQLFGVHSDPVLVPPEIDTAAQLIDWLFSPAANLIPRRDWYANTKEAAIVAILCKLIRNKSWNKDVKGHAWTKESDLLGQAPVSRPEHQEVLIEATRMLPSLQGKLLLTKGGAGGKTPKEWCINLTHLKAVKKAITDQSFTPLADQAELAHIIRQLQADDERPHRLDNGVVSERVRQLCRDRN